MDMVIWDGYENGWNGRWSANVLEGLEWTEDSRNLENSDLHLP
jgi:hypothetical protein